MGGVRLLSPEAVDRAAAETNYYDSTNAGFQDVAVLNTAYTAALNTKDGSTYLFGGITVLQLHSQALGVKIDAQILSMLPYLATILVLVLISHDKAKVRLIAPDSLGKPFHAPR